MGNGKWDMVRVDVTERNDGVLKIMGYDGGHGSTTYLGCRREQKQPSVACVRGSVGSDGVFYATIDGREDSEAGAFLLGSAGTPGRVFFFPWVYPSCNLFHSEGLPSEFPTRAAEGG